MYICKLEMKKSHRVTYEFKKFYLINWNLDNYYYYVKIVMLNYYYYYVILKYIIIITLNIISNNRSLDKLC